MRAKLIILALALTTTGCLALHAQAQQKTYRVIVHPDNPTTSLSAKDVSNLLLKKQSRWDGLNVSVSPIDQDSTSPVRASFSKDVHGRSVQSIKHYWQRQIFSGRGVPPPEVASDAEVIEHVKTHPGGIGYVSSNARLDGVKEIAIADG